MKRSLKFNTILPLLLPAVLLAGCQTSTFTHKDFPEKVARIHNVALVPRIHTAILNSYYGKDPSPARFPDEEQICSELTTSTIAQLSRRGFAVTEVSCPDSTNRDYPGFVEQVQSLAADGNWDGVMILDVHAYKSTPHRQRITSPENTISFLLTVASIVCLHPSDFPYEPWQGADVNVALVDGDTGDLLWSTWKDFDAFDKNKPSKDIDELFQQYPKPKP